MNLAAFHLGLPKPAYSQRFTFGVKVAGQITNTFTYPFIPGNAHDDRVLFGPTAEIRLPHAVSIEMDALYKRRLSYSSHCCVSRVPVFTIDETIDETTHAWELPLMLKWHLPVQHIPIFASAGFSARNVAGIMHTYGTAQTLSPPAPAVSIDTRTSHGDLVNPWTYGPVVSAGFDFYTGIVHLQPELRYTRWNDSPFVFFTKPDAVEVLVGIAVGK